MNHVHLILSAQFSELTALISILSLNFVNVKSFDEPIRSFTSSFHSSLLKQCSSIDLAVHGDFTRVGYSKIITAQNVFENPAIMQFFQQDLNHSLVSFISKHFFGCYIIVVKVDSVDSFSVQSLDVFSNYILSAYYIFVFPKDPDDPMPDDQLRKFSNTVRPIAKTLFLIVSDLGLKACVAEGTREKIVKTVYDSNYKTLRARNDLASLKESNINYQEDPIVALVCAICIPKEGPDGKMESADAITRSLRYLATVINATLALEPVFTEIKDSNFEDGEWDDWVKPLLEDTATISTFLKFMGEQNDIFYITTFSHVVKLGFVTALPKKLTFNSLKRLAGPFNATIWFFTLLSCIGLFLALQLISYFKKKFSANRLPKWAVDVHVEPEPVINEDTSFMQLLQTFISILQPLVDQSISGNVIETTTRLGMNRFLIGMWLLLLIALGGAYKTKMIEMVVLPSYTIPPRTFTELAASDYKIGALVYGVVQPELQTLNNTVSTRIQEHVTEDEYFEPKCYQRVLEEEAACMGPTLSFKYFGNKFMTDVNGRRLFLESKDNLFPYTIGVGLSKFYPYLIEPYNVILNGLKNGGFLVHWQQLLLKVAEKRGTYYARTHVDEVQYYGGKTTEHSMSQQVVPVAIQILRYGLMGSMSIFVLEMIVGFIKLAYNKIEGIYIALSRRVFSLRK